MASHSGGKTARTSGRFLALRTSGNNQSVSNSQTDDTNSSAVQGEPTSN